MKRVSSTKPKTFSESLDSLEAKFYGLNLDERFAFIEWFRPYISKMSDEFRKSIVSQLCDYLEKEMNKNLVDWLESEMEIKP
jgi:hypothetical protein